MAVFYTLKVLRRPTIVSLSRVPHFVVIVAIGQEQSTIANVVLYVKVLKKKRFAMSFTHSVSGCASDSSGDFAFYPSAILLGLYVMGELLP